MEIKNFKRIDKAGIVATGNVEISGVYVNDIKIKNGSNGTFFEMPGRLYKDAEGNYKTAYYAIPVSKESKDAILAQVQDALDNNKYRPCTSDKDKLLVGFCSLKVETPISAKVILAEKDGIKRVTTDYKKYEVNGETKYSNFVSLTKELADEILVEFEKLV